MIKLSNISEADRIVGNKYGRLTVLRSIKIGPGKTKSLCKCACGNEKIVWPYALKNGTTQSCGCLQRERTGSIHTTHGHTKDSRISPTYRAWVNMWSRCTNPKSSSYPFYGERGIGVCERWKSFKDFLSDVGERPSSRHSIDRIDPDGNYEHGNVRWETQQRQCRNRRSNRAVVRSDGTMFESMAEAADHVGGTMGGIWDVCNGKKRSHRGFAWRYA